LIRADLHFHTRYSLDATQQPRTVVERLNRHPTLNAIAITDHNIMRGYFETREYAKAYPDILIIPGIEISTPQGEIILLGLAEAPPSTDNVQEVIDYAKANHAVTIAPHPYRGLGLKDLIKELNIDAIETLNGITESHLNKQAQEVATARELASTAGSDAHFDTDAWNVQTEIDASLDVDAILQAIRKGHTRATSIPNSAHF
jgi:predicted metal-dependent phosphoesterase TrpH